MRSLREALVLVLAGACAFNDGRMRGALAREAALAEPAKEPVAETRQLAYQDSAVLQFRRRVLVHTDGRVERHGEESEWFPDGTLRSRRTFEHDRPTGVWTCWYEDGTLRSEIDFGDGLQPAPMRFWHPGGKLAAEGAGIAGVKEGHWTQWNADGVLESEGTYLASVREGPWTFWYANGTKRAEGLYARGQRVGEWHLWDEDGKHVVRQASVEEHAP